jgi:Poxvirus P4B major core protein.
MSESFTRDAIPGDQGGPDDNRINAQIDELLKKELNDIQALRLLREKYGEQRTVEKVFDAYKDRLNYINKKANKFKTLILSKHSNLSLPDLLKKAQKYKKKYNFTDEQFNAFLNLISADKNYSQYVYNQPTTPLAKALGYHYDQNVGKMSVSEKDLEVLNDIFRMQAVNSVLHDQIKIQTLMYTDFAPSAITGTYDEKKHNSFSYIHPVVAALFLPKIKYIDDHMLLASIANIVQSRYNGTPIKTQPEYELYYDLIVDPNEMSCTSYKESPIVDLKKRVRLQIELWKLVRELREGRYYCDDFRNFIIALDDCKTGFFDSPDMSYVRDEGTVLRKLFGVFGLRPTVASIATLNYGAYGGNYNISSMSLNKITTMPIVNLRLPITFAQKANPIFLEEALEQPDWVVENKIIVPKLKNIIFSRDILVFYANRRFQSINYGRIAPPYNFTALPLTLNSLEKINQVIVNYSPVVRVGDEKFHLKTVVFVEKALTNKDLIVGSSTGLVIKRSQTYGVINKPVYLLYDPQNSAIKFEDQNGNYIRNKPITWIPGSTPFNAGSITIESFQSRASKRGTIYVYVKDKPQTFGFMC